MAFRLSNILFGLLNFLTFLLSIPILALGIWIKYNSDSLSGCEKFMEGPYIAIGIFLMVISLAGFIGACCRVTWLMGIYMVFTFLLILLLFCFTVFMFVVTSKGDGETVPGRGFEEYKLGDYPEWFQMRVDNSESWASLRECAVHIKLCQRLQQTNESYTEFYTGSLSSGESGCCKPPTECNFQYVSPTVWTKTATNSTDPDCSTWNNDPSVLCYDCQSCKANVVHNIKNMWKHVAVFNIIFLIFIVIVYSVACCAFRNDMRDNKPNHGYYIHRPDMHH